MIQAVLFDMGGVLVELGSLPDLLGTARSAADFWPQWLGSPAVQEFERGRCDPEEFARRAVVDLELPIGPEEFLANFARFPRGLFPGSRQLVGDVARVATTAVLSNTNDLHWRTQPDAEIVRSMFDRSYLSYRIGAVKPEAEIFHHVLDDLGLPGDEVLFLDDNAINVDGARRFGIRAQVAKGPAQARSVLVEHQVLGPS
ncbi:MAG: HAD family phosphatase [Acidimicrobiia bacterium]|nr:HAD family phosphatase [Acidimicrobiia bacterium]